MICLAYLININPSNQDFTILAKTLLTLEGVVSKLDPDFSIMDVAEPFVNRYFDRYNPKM